MDKKMFIIGYFAGILFSILAIAIVVVNLDKVMKTVFGNTFELSQLSLQTLEGEKISINSTKPIVVNVWATWCKPCIEEFPIFEKIQAKYKGKVEFIYPSDEKLSTIQSFVKRNNFSLEFVRNAFSFDDLKINVRPTTIFYDGNGKVINSIIGSITEEKLEKEILNLIKN